MKRIRRLCGAIALLAFLLPIVPWALGSPVVEGWRGCMGVAPLYGESECLASSVALMLGAAVGTAATQSSVPRIQRRSTLPKAFGVTFLYLLSLSVATLGWR